MFLDFPFLCVCQSKTMRAVKQALLLLEQKKLPGFFFLNLACIILKIQMLFRTTQIPDYMMIRMSWSCLDDAVL